VTDFSALDNPIWSALTTVHASMALANGLARRYPGDISPLAALREPTVEAFVDLAELVGPQDGVGLFTPEPVEAPGNWQVVRTLVLEQMVCVERPEPPLVPLLSLGQADVPEMLALTAATEPGPFRPGTIRMGRYFGIRSGERLQLDGFTEISAVCSDPEFRGRGYARALVAFLAAQALGAGKTPFLHVTPTNGAKALYEKVGFRLRRGIRLTVLTLR
jgi:ribosomal protein S18 acetylase RimI-like enzyme